MAADDKIATQTSDDKAKAPVKAGKKGESISVTGPSSGRWRAGVKFGPAATVIDLSTITAEQLAAIEGDPELRVTRG
jgi:hypothetical protein